MNLWRAGLEFIRRLFGVPTESAAAAPRDARGVARRTGSYHIVDRNGKTTVLVANGDELLELVRASTRARRDNSPAFSIVYLGRP